MSIMQRFVGAITAAKATINDLIAGAATVDSLQVTGSLSTTGLASGSAADAITAHSGGGQANAVALTKQVNRISTVAAANDSVKLPPSAPGLQIAVVNGAASNSMQVFGAGTDTINGAAAATGVAQGAGLTAIYVCPVAGKWFQLLSA